MTDTNRTEAQAELRQVIADAFAAHTLWTTDWDGVQLKRCCAHCYSVCVPGLCSHRSFVRLYPIVLLLNLRWILATSNAKGIFTSFYCFSTSPIAHRTKNKTSFCSASENTQPPALSKKAKKALKQAQHAQVSAGSHYSSVVDYNDQIALNRRAERFQREHELEKTKHLHKTSHHSTNFGNGYSYGNGRVASMYSNGNGADEPEADPVSRQSLMLLYRWLKLAMGTVVLECDWVG